MGTRAISLWLRQSKFKKFYALGMDYAWGHNSVGVFKDEVTKAKKDYRRRCVFADRHQGFFHLHHQDPPVRRRGLLPGAAGRRQQRVPVAGARIPAAATRCSLLTSIVDLNSIQAVGDAAIGLAGRRATCSRSTTRRTRRSSRPGKKEYGTVPDVFEGEQWQACQMLQAGIEGGEEHRRRQAAPGAGDGRDRQHQGPGRDARLRPPGGAAVAIIVKVGKEPAFEMPVPKIIATFPGDEITPACRQMTFE